jgi:MYXO-CTERM domain-containing protein
MSSSTQSNRPRLRLFTTFAALGTSLALIGLVGCGSPESAEQASGVSQSIAGGVPDVSHKNVFLLASHFQGGGGLCTSTLIAPNLLLTARHCVSPGANENDGGVLCGESMLGDPYPATAFIATNDARPSQQSLLFRAREVRVPGIGEDTCGFDIALIILSENVPADVAVPAVPRIDREVTPGEDYTAVGYGENDAGVPMATRVEREGLRVACQPGSCGSGVESSEFMGETGICSGDSGGPALDKNGKVVGVVSRGGPDCSMPIYGTVTAWSDFITSTAKDAATDGNYEAPFWVTTGSSDQAPSGAAGSGGEGGGSPTAALAAEGESCGRAQACADGLVCYATSGAETGSCVRSCTTSAECPNGLSCQPVGGTSVCLAPQPAGDDSGGCAISSVSRADARLGWLAAGLGAVALLRRKRRH